MNSPAKVDARTAPVAAWAVVGAMNPEERAAWRVARITDNPSATERNFDVLPYPFGWYVVAYSDEVAVGEVKAVRYFGKEFALWRGEDGKARMIPAYCRHMGAHMGHGGKVHGNNLECPFHAWRYDGEGAVKEVPYSEMVPMPVREPCGGLHTGEVNGLIWMWYHPDGGAPKWELDVMPETSDPAWTAYDRYEWYVHCPLQLMAENAADNAHFQYVHGTATYPDGKLTYNGHVRTGLVQAKMGTPRGEVDGEIKNGSNGPGQSYTRFRGISETLLVSGVTPVDRDLLHVRFAFTQPREQAEGAGARLAQALIRDIVKQFDQDKVIWDRQRFVAQPILAHGDGPIGAFRRWYYQFYAEWPNGDVPA